MAHTEHEPAAASSQTTRRIVRATGALMLVQVILRGFGLIEKMILAKFFATSYLADAYNAARDIAMYGFQLADQVIMHSFLPVFVARLREEGEAKAWRLASTTANLLVIIMGTLAVIGILHAQEVLPWFMPDWFSPDSQQPREIIPLTIHLTQVMLLAMIFLTVSSLTYCLLNSYKKFTLPASADLALKGTVMVFAVLFAGKWGPAALAIGFVVGAIAKVGVHLIGLRGSTQHYQPAMELDHPSFKRFGVLALPLVVGVLFSIFRQFMDNRFTSGLEEGSLSALKYARTLCDLPVQFFPYAFGIALFPFLADIALSGDKDRLRSMLMSATRMMILIFVPLAIALIAMRFQIVHGIFGSEKFGEASAAQTTAPLQLYAVGMLVGALEIIVLQFFFAMSDTLRPTIVGMAMVPLHIAVAYMGISLWKSAAAIALALLVSKSTKVAILYGMMRRKLHSLEGVRTLALAGRVLVALIPFAAILYFGVMVLPTPGNVHGKLAKLVALLPFLVVGGVAMLAYLGTLWMMRTEEVTMLVDRVRGRIGKKLAGERPAPTE